MTICTYCAEEFASLDAFDAHLPACRERHAPGRPRQAVGAERAHRSNPASRYRRTTPELRAEVLQLRARGMVAAAIADALNLPDRRVKAILREADAG